MSIDDKIKNELESQASEIDNILAEEQGLADFVLGSVRSSLKGWFIVVNIVTLIVSGVMIWSGYEFVMADLVKEQIYWGVWLLVSLNAQIALKQWIWAEMSRSSIIREVKRVELAVSRQLAQLKP
ncbi:hypothetical protein QX776_04790 [Alteromonadaceae bacterium BrNp21-10]|nr:hypothetical protein [Alteromonadaceae bacterium BrNp21-10]